MEIIKQKEQIKPSFLDKDAPTDAYTYAPEKPEPTLAQYITELLSKRKLCVSAALSGMQKGRYRQRLWEQTFQQKGDKPAPRLCYLLGVRL